MKNRTITLALLILISALSVASSDASTETTDSSDSKTQAFAWIKAQLVDSGKYKEFIGHTPSGKDCGLYLTQFDMDDDYYVVVGYSKGRPSDDSYIGIVAAKSAVDLTETTLSFASDESWGNNSQWNRVKIITDADGKPVQADGTSDLSEIYCKLN
jgi:hypothetical protein